MATIKIDVNFTESPLVVDAGPLAAWLYVCGQCYCSRHPEAKGVIPIRMVYYLADLDEPLEEAKRLVRVGLWESTPDGFLVKKPSV